MLITLLKITIKINYRKKNLSFLFKLLNVTHELWFQNI
jgi:hypothetical protein